MIFGYDFTYQGEISLEFSFFCFLQKLDFPKHPRYLACKASVYFDPISILCVELFVYQYMY